MMMTEMSLLIIILITMMIKIKLIANGGGDDDDDDAADYADKYYASDNDVHLPGVLGRLGGGHPPAGGLVQTRRQLRLRVAGRQRNYTVEVTPRWQHLHPHLGRHQRRAVVRSGHV